MKNPTKNKPTDFELAILTVVWDRKGATARDVFEALQPDYPDLLATTVHKIMTVMIEKGFLQIVPDRRPFVFTAAIRKNQVQKSMLRELLDRAFSGSTLDLVMQALSTKKTSAAELAKIRQMIEKAEREEENDKQ